MIDRNPLMPMTDRHSGLSAGDDELAAGFAAGPGAQQQGAQAGAVDMAHACAVQHHADASTLDNGSHPGFQDPRTGAVQSSIQ